jgi:nucleoside-diphosphate-sugar epimerase
MTANLKILVTGARGFIGQPLCRDLVDKGYQVTGTARAINADDDQMPGLQLKETGDLETFEDWAALLQGVDAVVHLAARVHVMGESGDTARKKYRNANVTVTEKLLRAAVSAGVRRFVFLSSVKALGEGSRTPYTETSAAEPIDPYGISKLEAEQVVKAVGNETGIETVILRLPLVYGPGVRANFLRLMKMVEKGVPLPLSGVTNRRSMIFLENLVDVLQVCLHHEKAVGKTFMVSDGEDFSTPGLVREISRAMRKKPRLLPFPPLLLRLAGALTGKGQEVDRLLGSLNVDSSKIRNSLDWVPPYTVQQGIAKTVGWYLETISNSQAH